MRSGGATFSQSRAQCPSLGVVQRSGAPRANRLEAPARVAGTIAVASGWRDRGDGSERCYPVQRTIEPPRHFRCCVDPRWHLHQPGQGPGGVGELVAGSACSFEQGQKHVRERWVFVGVEGEVLIVLETEVLAAGHEQGQVFG